MGNSVKVHGNLLYYFFQLLVGLILFQNKKFKMVMMG